MSNNYSIYTQKSPLIAGLLSFFIPGLGQLYNDERGKALLILTAFFLSLFIAITGWNPLMTFRMFHNYHFSEVFSWGIGFRSFSDPTIVNLYRLLFFVVVLPILYIYQLFDAIFSAQRYNRLLAAGALAPAGFPSGTTVSAPSTMAFTHTPGSERPRQEPRQETQQTMQSGETSSGGPADQQPERISTAPPIHEKRNRLFIGGILVFIGFIFLLNDFLPHFNPIDLWPLIPLGLGLKLLWDHYHTKDLGQLIFGAILSAVGFLFMAEIWSPIRPFDIMGDMIDKAINRWYLALLFIGLVLIAQEIVRRNDKQNS